MQKRGQVTVFIIVGIVVLATVLGILILNSSISKKTAGNQLEQIRNPLAAPVYNYIQSCIYQTGKDAAIYVGEHGGYYELPVIADLKFYLPYYFYEEQNKMPSKVIVEQELSKYIVHELPFCLKNFESFEELGYEISYSEIETITTILPDKVIFNIDFPVTVKRENKEVLLKLFYAEIPIRIGEVHGLISEFMEIQQENTINICISCLNNLAFENNLKAEMYFVRENDYLFKLIDLESEEVFEYNFINKYPIGDEE